MKLASLKIGGRDGTPVVVSRDLSRMVLATSVVKSVRDAIEDWRVTEPLLRALNDKMEAFEVPAKQNRRSTSHSEFLEINRSHPLHKMVWLVRYPIEQPQLAHTALS